MNKEDLLKELDRMRENMIRSINSDFDNFRMKLTGEEYTPSPVYLDAPHRFIGTKPVKLYIGSEEYAVKKWSEVTSIILSTLNDEHHDEIRTIADKYQGKKRVILASSGEGMDKPVKVDEDLYFEGHFGIEATLTHLLRFCKYTGYDKNNILVSIIDR